MDVGEQEGIGIPGFWTKQEPLFTAAKQLESIVDSENKGSIEY